MRSLLPLAFVSALVLTACNAGRDAGEAPSSTAPVVDQPATDVPPATAPTPPPSATPPPAATPAGDARFDGYGDMRIGMKEADARAAWNGELKRLGAEGDACYHLTPTWVKVPADFAFMVEDGIFVRYSTESAKFTAPGGGTVGMTTAQIEALYPGRIERTPHKYTDGQYLRIKDTANANRALLFETDAKGTVTEWRVGQVPQVDYVEGCS